MNNTTSEHPLKYSKRTHIETKIYTYVEPPGSDIIVHFTQSWMKNGWSVVILGKQESMLNPNHDRFMAKVAEFPTINNREYENICYRRWLAFQRQAQIDGGIFFADYDTLNINYPPIPKPSASTLFMPGLGFGYLSPHTDALKAIEEAPVTAPHMSDMTIFLTLPTFITGYDLVHNVPHGTKLIHFHGETKRLFAL